MNYEKIILTAKTLIDSESDAIANMANISALLYSSMEDVNWAGFYRMMDGELVLGPFQGKPACIRIPSGKGVCGTAVMENRTVVVPDIHKFPGHIACDAASLSEIVIPIRYNGEVVAVLDIDSPSKGRFEEADRLGLEAITLLLENQCTWKKGGIQYE